MLGDLYRLLKRNNCRKKLSKRNVIIQNNTFIDNETQIGDYSYIGYNTTITKSIIGRYVSIANNVSIGMGEHLIDKISTSSLFYENPYETLTADEIVIGDDVWIGVNAVILRGVKIGRGAVIGAGAVVTKDVPAYSVVVGVPAKVLKVRFNQEIIKRIEESKWWTMEIEESRGEIKRLETFL